MGLTDLLLRPLDILAPTVCAACGLPGAVACAACLAALIVLAGPSCLRCGRPLAVSVAACAECPPAIHHARQAVHYLGPAPPLVTAMKDGRRRSVARVLAARMAAVLPRPPPHATLVPVPLAAARERERGFNQSLLLARALGHHWGLPVVSALARVRDGPPQRGATATERRRQVAGAFATRPGVRVPEAPWLVDDVHTTGATLAACARALRRAGAARVGAVCFARVPPGGR